MLVGLQLAGTPADGAALAVLVEAAPRLAEAPWSVVLELNGPGSVLLSEAITDTWIEPLQRRGLPLVTVAESEGALVISPLVGEPRRWPAWRARQAPRLLEALRPSRLPGEPLVDEAVFVMRADSPAPRQLLERLLLLERGDAQFCHFAGDDGPKRLAVRVTRPPLYLLMTARDGEDEVDVYARGNGPLWVAWSYHHPLAEHAAATLARANQQALVDRDGVWHRTGPDWRLRSIHDAIAPELPALQIDLHPAEPDVRFQVRLRLAPGPVTEPDLWLLSPQQLLELEPLIEASTSDELGRLTVARLTGNEGTVYLLRERVRPGATRMAIRVSDTLGLAGHAKVAGADNLYIPTGRKLVPLLRRDDLRTLLGLDRAHTVVITEDRDGPRVITIAEVDEAPLQRWIDYVATDRRLELDRLLERSVFEFPEVSIAWPEVLRPVPERAPREARGPRLSTRAPARAEAVVATPEPTTDAELATRLRALRERARELERRVIVGGCDEVEVWRELGEVKARLDESDEAVDCFELALLHAGTPHPRELSALLVATIRGPASSDDLLTELVIADRRTPAESSRLGAWIVDRLAAGRPPPDEVMQLALPIFADPRLPVPRRLAWTVLAAWHHHAHDRLGVTRAKESVLGGINERGLSELHDLPRFVRQALSREADDSETEASEPHAAASGDRLQQGQLLALDALWHTAELAGIPELDARSNYLRLIFAIGFARLGARGLAQELIAPIELELDVHDPCNRALFRLYMARLAHESSGGSAEAWTAEVARGLESVRDPKHRQGAQWLQRRSLWLRVDAEESTVTRKIRYVLPQDLDSAGLAEHLARALGPGNGLFDFEIAEAVDVCMRRALASGSDAIVADVLASAEPGLAAITILSHRAEAIAACIHGAACLGDDAMLNRLLDALVAIARDKQLGSAQELTHATMRGLVAMRRFGGVEPARALLEALAGVQALTSGDRIRLLSTVASGFVQLGEERTADTMLDRLCDLVLGGSLDYVGRAQAGLAVAGALRHWPNTARVDRFRRFLDHLDVFRDTFTASRWFETHRIQMLEAIVDSLADSRTRHSDRVQGFLDHEEHALRRRIVTDWSALCGP